MGLASFLGWLRAKWFDLCWFLLSTVQIVTGPLAFVKLTGMKSTHSMGTSSERYEICSSCVPTTKSPGVGEV